MVTEPSLRAGSSASSRSTASRWRFAGSESPAAATAGVGEEGEEGEDSLMVWGFLQTMPLYEPPSTWMF